MKMTYDRNTVISLSIGTDMPEQTMEIQIRRRRMRRLIWISIVSHSSSTSTGSGTDLYKINIKICLA